MATHREAPRSELAGVLLLQADRPAIASLPALAAFAFVEHEMEHTDASALAHILDKAGAWNKTYQGLGDWRAAKAGMANRGLR